MNKQIELPDKNQLTACCHINAEQYGTEEREENLCYSNTDSRKTIFLMTKIIQSYLMKRKRKSTQRNIEGGDGKRWDKMYMTKEKEKEMV